MGKVAVLGAGPTWVTDRIGFKKSGFRVTYGGTDGREIALYPSSRSHQPRQRLCIIQHLGKPTPPRTRPSHR
jgi:hypothetical protein